MSGLPCSAAASLKAKADQSFQYPQEVLKRLGRIFGVRDFTPYLETVDPALADITYTAMCDGGDLPCGPGGCVNPALQDWMSALYDEKWCTQYAGKAGGARFASLLMYPLVK